MTDGRTGANEYLHLMIVSDSVKTGDNYVLDNTGLHGTVVIGIGGKAYETQSPSPFPPYLMTIHIDKHAGGWITGTFSGEIGTPRFSES